MVRGLALRSLCSLRIANIAEYVMIPLRQSLNDPSPYVRKVRSRQPASNIERAPACFQAR